MRFVLCCLASLAAVLPAAPAFANDRPFQNARTAVAEDDDAGTWSFETWVQRFGRVRGLSFEPEYTFTREFSVQVELTRLHDRDGGESGHEAEVELKYVFNQIARDGWGLALSAAFATERTTADGRSRALTLKLPLSIALGDSGALLHLNAGVIKRSDARREFSVSAAAQAELFRRTEGFVEIARDGGERFAQVGLRHWVKREKLALDVSLQQHRADGVRQSGFILGLGWYDL